MIDPELDGEPLWTVPNAVSVLRIVGLAPLLWAAYTDRRGLFLGIVVVLILSDWVDGKLAGWLDQGTVRGARLDSAADWVMYVAIGLSFWWLERDVILLELPWFVSVGASWSLSAAVALVRFGRLPSYHTLAAKTSWLVAGVVTVAWIALDWSAAVPWALGLVTLTNLEATAIGLVLPEWRANVPTVAHALRERGGDGSRGAAS